MVASGSIPGSGNTAGSRSRDQGWLSGDVDGSSDKTVPFHDTALDHAENQVSPNLNSEERIIKIQET